MQDVVSLRKRLRALPSCQLLGLCQIGLNEPVLASDVPIGLDLKQHEIGLVLDELGWRMGLVGATRGIPDVMGAAEAASALGVNQSNLRVVGDLPAPIVRLAATPLWNGAEIRSLSAKRRAVKWTRTRGHE
jgi:hypothetical protein